MQVVAFHSIGGHLRDNERLIDQPQQEVHYSVCATSGVPRPHTFCAASRVHPPANTDRCPNSCRCGLVEQVTTPGPPRLVAFDALVAPPDCQWSAAGSSHQDGRQTRAASSTT